MAADKGLEFVISVDARAARRDGDRRQAPAADHHQPAVERLQVHQQGQACRSRRARRTRAGAPATRCSTSAGTVVAFSRGRYRHRHPAQQAAPDLRGVPAGRRHHQPRVRRHRASACRSAASWRGCSAARSASAARPGEGSAFTLYLPLAYRPAVAEPGFEPDSPERAAPRSAPAPHAGVDAARPRRSRRGPPTSSRSKKVLVVDDDIRNVFALTSALEQHGMRVLHAESGKEGIEVLKRAPRHRRGADGRDDAGPRRLRHHAHRAPARRLPVSCRSSRSPPRR